MSHLLALSLKPISVGSIADGEVLRQRDEGGQDGQYRLAWIGKTGEAVPAMGSAGIERRS